MLTTRFDHRRVPLTVELDSAEGLSEPADLAAPGLPRAFRPPCGQIFGALSDRERIILANLDLNVRELALVVLRLVISQAAQLRQRLTDRLIAELKDHDRPAGNRGRARSALRPLASAADNRHP